MQNKYKKFLFITLLLIPSIVAASSSSGFPISGAIFMEAFVTIHMTVFVLIPLSKIFGKENSKNLFWKLFIGRIVILLLADIFISPAVAVLDFFAVFIGAFIVVPISAKATGTPINQRSNQVIDVTNIPVVPTTGQVSGVELRCAKCNSIINVTDTVCKSCGAPIEGNNVVVSENAAAAIPVPPKVSVKPANFDNIYSLSEDRMLEEVINRELTKAGMDKSSKLIPSEILRRKNLMNIIFSILFFVYLSLIFIHFPMSTYVIGLIILVIFFIATRRYNLMKYLQKELKSRPGEKISNIIMSVKSTAVTDNSKSLLIIGMIASIILVIVIFTNPIIIYEKVDDGYAVRYYMFGIKNYTSVEIPETHNNENVVSLRGNTFSNMPFLKSVTLPNTIKEIRGQAFKNCTSLEEVKLPPRLEYLGGGAFYNATSLKKIELPDTLTYLGGESFYGAKSLKEVKLSEALTEIRGDSFEYCTSLESITIPDSVTRIGGHAFYGDISLSEVKVSENSKLVEIGSSAFRLCQSLYEVTLPSRTVVNTRAFKESPTVINRYGQDNGSGYYNYEDPTNKEPIEEIRFEATESNAYIFRLKNKVEFRKYDNITLEYSEYASDHVTFTYTKDYQNHTITTKIAKDYKSYYVIDDYIISFKLYNDGSVYAVINKTSAINPGYRYYINAFGEKGDIVNIASSDIGNIEIKILETGSLGDYIKFELKGGINQVVTLTENNRAYIYGNIMIDVKSIGRTSQSYYVIYIK